jgi:hypothetical protein
MNITFNASEVMYEIEQEIAKIPKELKGQTKQIMSKASKIVKSNVEQELGRHRTDPGEKITNYDGTPYVHMKDDVKASVKDDKEGSVFAIIRGGKYTAYKWHLVNNGHLDKAGNTVEATHFIDIALKKSESDIDALIDKMISKAVE